MAKEILINVSEGEECRIALLEDGKLEELYMERTSSTSHVGNIYKGRVTNVEPSIQAAFVDFGLGRNGFLHISDVMPTYFGKKGEDIVETVGKKMSRRDRPPIQRCLRRGDEITVQIIKEGIGTKGPTLSTYLSIPGRILVMMPGMGKMGVSRKIEDDEERRRLRQILDGLKPPRGVGFIIRTAGVGKAKTEIERDLKYLTRLWETIEKKEKEPSPVELYTEGDLVTRTVRDVFTADIDRIVVDNKEVAKRVRDVIKLANPRTRNKVELYEDPVPLFHQANIEHDIEMMYSRHVPLPSGGSLVIDSTEAIVAIDVNSGKFREHADAETTAFKTDLEAADEIPRQLRLRDLGGVIICDFIDLRFERHRRELEERLHENLKKDRAKTKFLNMSQFGIIEMTRQRMRPSLKRSIYFDCPHCKGAGLVKTPESMSLDAMRRVAIALNDQRVARAELVVCNDVAFYLQNRKRKQIADLEAELKKRVVVRGDPTLGLDEMRIDLFDMRDAAVIIPELNLMQSQPPHTSQLETGRRGGRGGKFDVRRNQNRQPPRHAPPAPSRSRDASEDRYDIDDVEDAVDEREDKLDSRPPREESREESHDDSRDDSRDDAPRQNSPAFETEADTEADTEVENDDGSGPGNERFDRPPQGQGEGQPGPRRRRRGRRGRGRGRGNAPLDQAGPVGQNVANTREPRDSRDVRPLRDPYNARDPRDARDSRGPAAPQNVYDNEAHDIEEAPDDAEHDAESVDDDTSPDSVIFPPSSHPAGEQSPDGAPKRRRRRRGGRRHRRRKENAANGDAPQPTGTGTVIADTPVVRTGSTDRHLVSDEPVIPPPISRPRSYRDLDAIPDDLD